MNVFDALQSLIIVLSIIEKHIKLKWKIKSFVELKINKKH